jgi:hypothetical protein
MLGYPVGAGSVVSVGLISSNSVVKSPTSVAVVPTLELAPFKLILTWSRSANNTLSTVRVQKVNTTPFCRVIGGVSSQLLSVAVPEPSWKLAAM